MFAIIGYVICGYVFVRMLEITLTESNDGLLKGMAGLLGLGALVAALLIWRVSSEASAAIQSIPTFSP